MKTCRHNGFLAKGGALYNNASWDLVDAALEEGFDWTALSLDDLPPEMRSMTHEQRMDFIESRRVQREVIQLEIQQLSAEREAFIKSALTARSGEANGLGSAMRQAIREQAMAKGFTCDGC